MTYENFLRTKRLVVPGAGITDGYTLSDRLFPFQRDLVTWALRRGRAALFCECGLGKGWMALEWARVVSDNAGRVLVIAPLAVAQQFQREAAKLGVPVTLCREASDVADGINVTNYERFDRFDSRMFAGVVLDECFAPNTKVQRLEHGFLCEVPISMIQVGDEIVSAHGIDRVADVHRREVQYAVIVRFGKREVVSSPNHPWLTRRGWVPASCLREDDELIRGTSAVCLVQEGVFPKVEAGEHCQEAAVLREVLLSEMADDAAGSFSQGPQSGSGPEARSLKSGMVGFWVGGRDAGDRSDSQSEPEQRPGSANQDLPPVESHGARTFRAWGERAWFDQASGDSTGCTWTELGGGIASVFGPTSCGLSHALQDRSRLAEQEARNRGGWQLTPQQEASRREERRDARFVRVDGVEVLEPGDPRLERFRSADGKLYFYDIGATQHPSFTLGGDVLVHNSSILKNYSGSTRNALVDAWKSTPYRLACTATPAPNDHMELGNHAEFLGVMSRVEMLSRFFVHDGGETQKWRLKGHAVEEFWRWVSGWSANVKRPSDLGYSDEGYDLPPLNMHHHVVAIDSAMVRAAGMLFAPEVKTLNEQRAYRKASIGDRVKVAASLANDSKAPWLIWCDLNDESSMLTKSIPDAVEIKGSDSAEHKESAMIDFIEGRSRVLVSKPSICGWGVNLQHCANTTFVGVSHSFELWYQAIRRVWRFGQTLPVECHVVTSEADGAVVANLERKARDFDIMADGTLKFVRELTRAAVKATERDFDSYNPTVEMRVPEWLRSEAE